MSTTPAPSGSSGSCRWPELRREKLAVGDSGGQVLVVYHAEPGSQSAAFLALLGSLAATGSPERAATS